MMPIRIGTSTSTIQAPSANLEIATSIATIAGSDRTERR